MSCSIELMIEPKLHFSFHDHCRYHYCVLPMAPQYIVYRNVLRQQQTWNVICSRFSKLTMLHHSTTAYGKKKRFFTSIFIASDNPLFLLVLNMNWGREDQSREVRVYHTTVVISPLAEHQEYLWQEKKGREICSPLPYFLNFMWKVE